MELTIECKKRAENSKANALRQQGQIPAILYGHNGSESIPLTLAAKDVETLMKKAVVNNTIVQLNVPEAGWNGKTLLREVQTHPAKGFLQHLSFFAIANHGNVTVTLPLHYVGESTGVKNNGGIFNSEITEVSVQCPPDQIPENIEIDITQLEVGDVLRLHDLTLPAGVEPFGEADPIVATVLSSRNTPATEQGVAETL